MNMLYDSDEYVVIYLDVNAVPDGEPERGKREGFEIVQKRLCKSVYLDGPWADYFSSRIKAWQEETPEQAEVEAELDGLTQLAQIPLQYH